MAAPLGPPPPPAHLRAERSARPPRGATLWLRPSARTPKHPRRTPPARTPRRTPPPGDPRHAIEPLLAGVLGHDARSDRRTTTVGRDRGTQRGQQITPGLHRPRHLPPAPPGQCLQQLRGIPVALTLRQPCRAPLAYRARVDDARRTGREHIEGVACGGDLAHQRQELAVVQLLDLPARHQRDDAVARHPKAVDPSARIPRTNVRIPSPCHQRRNGTPPATAQGSPAPTRYTRRRTTATFNPVP